MNSLSRRLHYYLEIFPLIKSVENWPEIFRLYFKQKRLVVLRLRSGVKFQIKHHLDALTIKEIFLDDQYGDLVKEPKVIIDVGANIGTFSVLQSIKHPKSKILSFEPAPTTFRMLSHNIKINDVENIKAFNQAVSAKNGALTFYTHSSSGLSSLIKSRPHMRKEKVKSTTLAQVFQDNEIISCDLLKLDCEGAEYDILFKLPINLFNKIKNIAMEYHDSLTPHNHKDLVKVLKERGYQVKVRPHPLENDIGLIFAKRK